VREELALYYAMITDLDAQLGRILAALPSFDDTIIIFTADQGLALGSHGLLGKQNQYEHSIRSPLHHLRPRTCRKTSAARRSSSSRHLPHAL
jgi:arylsulfatase A-like enzyme